MYIKAYSESISHSGRVSWRQTNIFLILAKVENFQNEKQIKY